MIYALLDPISTLIVYIGLTTTPLKNRLSAHMGTRITGHFERVSLHTYLGALWERGLRPEIHLLEEVQDGRYAEEREYYWIAQAFRSGAPLLNCNAPDPIREELYRLRRKPLKVCAHCGLTKPNTPEHFSKIKLYDGLSTICIVCRLNPRRKK